MEETINNPSFYFLEDGVKKWVSGGQLSKELNEMYRSNITSKMILGEKITIIKEVRTPDIWNIIIQKG